MTSYNNCCKSGNPQIIEHSVAQDVKAGEYFQIDVLHAKYADASNSVPTIVDEEPQLKKGNKVVFHLLTEAENGDIVSNTFEKIIDNVENATTATYDTKHRELSKMLNEEDAGNFIDLYLATKNLVFSVNNRTGNVLLDKDDVNLAYVDNTSDMDKPVSYAQQAALDLKQNIELSNPLTVDLNVYTTVEDALHALNGKVIEVDDETIKNINNVLSVKKDDVYLIVKDNKLTIAIDSDLDETSELPVYNKAVTLELNTKQKIFQYETFPEASAELYDKKALYQALVSYDSFKQGLFYTVIKTGEDYSWKKVTSSGTGAVLVLTREELNRRKAITDDNDDDYIAVNSIVYITDEDDYVYGVEI